MAGLVQHTGEQHERCQRRRGHSSALLLVFFLLTLHIVNMPVNAMLEGTTHRPVLALNDGEGEDGNGGRASSSSIGIIIGCIVGIAAVLLIVGFVTVLCLVRRRRILLSRRSHAYADADSIALQDERHSHHQHHQQGRANAAAGLHDGSEMTGQYSHHTVDSNEPVTPPENRTTPRTRDRRDNYADRTGLHAHSDDENGYDADGGVRPASPTAERVEGLAIENRIRPRRHLPRGQVVIHQGDQDVCLDFRGVERVPQAGPPPLTAEEKQRIIDAQNRVASPEFYGRAEYEYRRASNNNTPNVLLSSSLLRELQQQYRAAASASGQVFPSYASDAGHSVGSMSFRPGSPAGSVRRGRRDGRQSTSPTSLTLGGGQTMRQRNTGSRNNTNSRDVSAGHHQHASIPRHYRDDLESTSDDFEDLSLHNDSFTVRRERARDASGGPLPVTATPGFPTLGVSWEAVDQVSLRSNSPAAFDRYLSANGSMHAGAGLNGSVASGLGIPSSLDPPAAMADNPHALPSARSASITSPVNWAAAWPGPTYPTTATTTTTAAVATNGTASISNGSAQSPKSSRASHGLPATPPRPLPPSPSHPIIQFIGEVADGGSTGALPPSQQQQQRQQYNVHGGADGAGGQRLGNHPHASVALATPVFSVPASATPTAETSRRGAWSTSTPNLQPVDASVGVGGSAAPLAMRADLPPPVMIAGQFDAASMLDRSGVDPALHPSANDGRAQASPTTFLLAAAGNGSSMASATPLQRPPRKQEEEKASGGVSRDQSAHSKRD